MIRALLCLLLLAPLAHAETIAITDATIYVTPTQKLEKATLILRDGKIAAVGVGIAVPNGAKVVLGTGKVVTAGIIEAASQLGLIEIDQEAAANDGRFAVQPRDIHAAYRARDAYDRDSVAIPVARTGGVTAAITGPRGGLIAGQSALVSLAAGAEPVRAPIAMNAALGRQATQIGSRGHAALRMRALLDDAALYRQQAAAFDRNQLRHTVADRLDLAALAPVLAGTLPLVIDADSAVDIRAALAIARERKLRLVLVGGTEAWQLRTELAAAKVAVLLDPTLNLPTDLAAHGVRDDNAALLAQAGVTVAITTLGQQAMTRTLRQLAGIAVANGLPYAKALAAITQTPARIFGLTDRGTLERGKVADVVVWTGDPLELSSRAETVIIGGVVQSLTTHQTRLRDRYREVPGQLPY